MSSFWGFGPSLLPVRPFCHLGTSSTGEEVEFVSKGLSVGLVGCGMGVGGWVEWIAKDAQGVGLEGLVLTECLPQLDAWTRGLWPSTSWAILCGFGAHSDAALAGCWER